MESELRARLLADGTIAGLVGTRVDWNTRPQGKPLPAITLMTPSDTRDQHMEGFQVTRDPLVQIDVWTLKMADRETLREAVIAALAPAATVGSVSFLRAQDVSHADMSEMTEEGTVRRSRIQLRAWHTVSA